MKDLRTRLATLLLATGLSLGIGTACGGQSDGGNAQGVVQGVDRAKAQITIQHGEIPGMMKAMTMSFGVSDPKLLEGVKDGDEVDFKVRYAEGKYTVTAIDPR